MSLQPKNEFNKGFRSEDTTSGKIRSRIDTKTFD